MLRRYLIILLAVLLTPVFYVQAQTEGDAVMTHARKKVVLIVASKNFRDEEFFTPYRILNQNNYQVDIASSTKDVIQGMLGGTVKPTLLYTDIDPTDYEAVLFIGGGGAREYFDAPQAHAIAQKTVALNKVLGAICIAPVTLARAGVLEGKKATVWPGNIQDLEDKGALYTEAPVETDGRIVTANGPDSATAFSETVVDLLKNP